MPKVLVSDPIGPEGVSLLETGADVDVKTGMKPAELLDTVGAMMPWWSAARPRSTAT